MLAPPVDICGRDRLVAPRGLRAGAEGATAPETLRQKGPQIDGALESSRWQGRLTEGV